jgi:orotate phosphoribosyltransferase
VVASILDTDCISTKKVNDKHTFNPEELECLHFGRPRILIDDIFNNGETLRQIVEGLRRYGLTLDGCHFMVDRNPAKS